MPLDSVDTQGAPAVTFLEHIPCPRFRPPLRSKLVAPYPFREMAGRYRKKKIPKAVRESIWLTHCGKVYETKCLTPWCQNTITVNDFQAGHRVPESKGGPTTLENLVPICSRCNLSMGNSYTFDEWSALKGSVVQSTFRSWLCCFTSTAISPLPSLAPPSTPATRAAQSRGTAPPAPVSQHIRRG